MNIASLVSPISNLFRKKIPSDITDSFESLQGIDRIKYADAIKRLDWFEGKNVFLLHEDPLLLFYPHNDGMPTCPFVWARNKGSIVNPELYPIMDNQKDFTQISNLSDILQKTTTVMQESYEKKIPVVYEEYFGLRLTDQVKPHYTGKAQLVWFVGDHLKKGASFKDATNYFCNRYLDVFIGWNFGDVVKANSELEKQLLSFAEQLNTDKVRPKEHPAGFEVTYRGTVNQFYAFPPFTR